VLLDTFYVQAILNPDDAYHARAVALAPRIEAATEVVVTEAVLIEIGDALSDKDRAAAVAFVRACYGTPNITVVPLTGELMARALTLYDSRPDKAWGMTDCISFVVMAELRLAFAATGDRHFAQAGFVPLLETGA
jgi:predicted nucleic acid-binding protein